MLQQTMATATTETKSSGVKRDSWAGLDESLMEANTADSNHDDDSKKEQNVQYNDIDFNDPTDRRSSWGDLDSLLGQFEQTSVSARPNLESIVEGKSSRSLGRQSRGSPGSTKSRKPKNRKAELRQKIIRSRSAGSGRE